MDSAVSVVLVSDYESGRNDWLRGVFSQLAAQTYRGPVEYLLVVTEGTELSPDAIGLLPTLRVITTAERTSFARKTVGVRAATAGLVALLDLDCIPASRWLQAFVNVMEQNPSIVA